MATNMSSPHGIDEEGQILLTRGDHKMLEGEEAQKSLPKKWISLLAVLALTVILVCLAGPLQSAPAEPQHADITGVINLNGGSDPVTVVQGLLYAWGKGDFNGQGASAKAAKYIAQDVWFKSTYDFKNIDLFKSATGVDGYVSWCKKQPTVYKIKQFTPSLSSGAPGSGQVIMMMNSKIVAINTGKANSEPFNDIFVFTVKYGKISSMEYYPERGDEFDGLFINGDPVTVVQAMLGAWGNGDFNGESATFEAAKYVAQDMWFKSAYNFKNTDIFQPFSGLDGMLSWCRRQPMAYDLKQFIPSISAGVPGSGQVIMMLQQTVMAKNTGKTNIEPFHDVNVFTVKDGKISSLMYYPERGDEFDGLFGSICGFHSPCSIGAK